MHERTHRHQRQASYSITCARPCLLLLLQVGSHQLVMLLLLLQQLLLQQKLLLQVMLLQVMVLRLLCLLLTCVQQDSPLPLGQQLALRLSLLLQRKRSRHALACVNAIWVAQTLCTWRLLAVVCLLHGYMQMWLLSGSNASMQHGGLLHRRSILLWLLVALCLSNAIRTMVPIQAQPTWL